MSLIIRSDFNGVTDPDAGAYIAAVEAADGQLLEFAVGKAINDFVVGCKADGIWNAIKASCILAGARTLAGALVPLVGTAPTNFNFAAGDYNRRTGLVGNGSTKYLNSNRAANADPVNSAHVAVYQSTQNARTPTKWAAGTFDSAASSKGLAVSGALIYGIINEKTLFNINDSSAVLGLWGASRSSTTSTVMRYNGANYSSAISSSTASANPIMIFARSGVPATSTTATDYSNDRLAFYSIGESLDLALLNARVTALINAFGAAIP